MTVLGVLFNLEGTIRNPVRTYILRIAIVHILEFLDWREVDIVIRGESLVSSTAAATAFIALSEDLQL